MAQASLHHELDKITIQQFDIARWIILGQPEFAAMSETVDRNAGRLLKPAIARLAEGSDEMALGVRKVYNETDPAAWKRVRLNRVAYAAGATVLGLSLVEIAKQEVPKKNRSSLAEALRSIAPGSFSTGYLATTRDLVLGSDTADMLRTEIIDRLRLHRTHGDNLRSEQSLATPTTSLRRSLSYGAGFEAATVALGLCA